MASSRDDALNSKLKQTMQLHLQEVQETACLPVQYSLSVVLSPSARAMASSRGARNSSSSGFLQDAKQITCHVTSRNYCTCGAPVPGPWPAVGVQGTPAHQASCKFIKENVVTQIEKQVSCYVTSTKTEKYAGLPGQCRRVILYCIHAYYTASNIQRHIKMYCTPMQRIQNLMNFQTYCRQNLGPPHLQAQTMRAGRPAAAAPVAASQQQAFKPPNKVMAFDTSHETRSAPAGPDDERRQARCCCASCQPIKSFQTPRQRHSISTYFQQKAHLQAQMMRAGKPAAAAPAAAISWNTEKAAVMPTPPAARHNTSDIAMCYGWCQCVTRTVVLPSPGRQRMQQ